jgi:rare lipoprotein A (peptidoglycan hydrolase)
MHPQPASLNKTREGGTVFGRTRPTFDTNTEGNDMSAKRGAMGFIALLFMAGFTVLPGTQAHADDRSGRVERGKASVYSKKFDGREMADGRHYDPRSNVAASKTLPLGTTAKVVNLNTGKSANVRVEDRGPYVRGRVMDVTPKVAGDLSMKKAGVAPVKVAPIAVPEPDGRVKLGAGAAETPPDQVAEAVRTTKELSDRR